MSQSISAVHGDVLLLAGTRKGGFALTGSPERKEWRLTGPFLQGSEIFHRIYDWRSGGTLVAAENQRTSPGTFRGTRLNSELGQ